ncbi:MAG TPA: ATP synthase F0 subunit B [Candidatus Acidoferrales bacterium]|nr:ATP synthase F0 subunit B [Candidatus Acidoferrales bacterium]
MFLSFDGTALIQLVNFAIFFALLNVLFLKPVGEAIRKRREYINSVTEDYDRYQGEAKALRARAEKIRSDARRDAEQVLARTRGDASNEASKLTAEFSQKVQATVEEADRRAREVLQRARADEERVVAELSEAMVRRAAGEAIAP